MESIENVLCRIQGVETTNTHRSEMQPGGGSPSDITASTRRPAYSRQA